MHETPRSRYLRCMKEGRDRVARGSHPQLAVEFARKAIFTDERPNAKELEEACAKVKARLAAAAVVAGGRREDRHHHQEEASGHAGHHGGAWKVAYADFVTAMMALFMVLWLVSQTDQKLKKSLSDYFRTGRCSPALPLLLEGGAGVADRGFVDTANNPPVIEPIVLERNAEQVRKAVAQALSQPELKGLADQVTVKVSENGILIQIAEGRDDMLFDLSSSDLKPALTKLLADRVHPRQDRLRPQLPRPHGRPAVRDGRRPEQLDALVSARRACPGGRLREERRAPSSSPASTLTAPPARSTRSIRSRR